MAAVVFPPMLLREQSAQWLLQSQVASPGRTGAGAFPLVRLDGGGLWSCRLSSINLRRPEHVKLWRAIEGLADGGAQTLVVPMCDKRHGPFPLVEGKKLYGYGSIPHSDSSYFDDGSGYSQRVIVVEVAAGAALRATSLSIDVVHAGAIEGGEYFSINHDNVGWRLYLIKVINDGVITFSPPLREAVTEGTELEFDQPRCTMRLADPQAMSLDMNMRRFGNPNAAFIEAFG